MRRAIILAVVLAAIIGLIIYLEDPRDASVQRVETVKKSGTPAPELAGIAGFINTDGITLQELVGKKVVLVDIWTYSCINCQRTLPYITAWHQKYKGKGLEIVGVHSPEFAFEKEYGNVKRAVEKFDIKYPVVLDNDHATWNAFNNRYWPAKYLIDIDGYIAWQNFGEGAYEEAERKIQELLMERAGRLGMSDGIVSEMSEVAAETPDFGKINTPEIYLGSVFTRGNFGNKEGLPGGNTITYSLPEKAEPDEVYLEGTWYVDSDHVRLVGDTGRVVLNYDAKNVNIVASSEDVSDVAVFVDKRSQGVMNVKDEDLYNVVTGEDYGAHTLSLRVQGSGFKLYTFTFG
jgi:thiol-disulfide isomerase/thioredoxin